jgi:prepilin-type processing-associated H-X9-DG protein
MRHCRELLWVLVISALLFFTLAAGSLNQTRQAQCAGNLRQLYQMILAYEEDHGGIPPVTIPMKPLWKFWSDCLRPYSKDPLVFVCPADPRNAYMFEKQSPLFSHSVQKAASYGMNWFLKDSVSKKHGAPSPKLQFLSNPAQIVLFADSKGPYLMPERYWEFEKDFRHGDNQANFAFADGHVELLRQQDFGTFQEDGKFVTDFSKWRWQ